MATAVSPQDHLHMIFIFTFLAHECLQGVCKLIQYLLHESLFFKSLINELKQPSFTGLHLWYT